ncbi:molybdopterin-dependent oxidoreductase [Sulfuritalea sp.]|uniref:molybdopterin-dependent oxidoreductase n=1 Tax=Sulfuritalea sp. TaxID=2480090 RepID=UPI001AC76E6C|nr:molybdopterin-dependent oxidoreductase [Sulfuritalea sp.]MBN8477105.1 molybdopterin-dependent oxidoreductase [Sulfuritalea sp.]
MKVDFKNSFCYQCNAGPDLLRVRRENGVAVCIEPRFDAAGIHPADGRVCVKAYGLIQKAYNPYRITHPMKRTNPRKGRNEDPGFVPITWDEAYDAIAGKLKRIREEGLFDASGYPRVACSIGEAGLPVHHMGTFAAFLVAYGPMDTGFGAGQGIQCYHSEHFYGELWHRSYTVSADAEHVNYILSLGSNIDASGGPCGVWRGANARGRGARRVQVEPHLSVTGASATEWIPIRPKTDAAFLYSILHSLLFDHGVAELDGAFLKHRTASPYLVGPNGYFLRDAATHEPLVWDLVGDVAVMHATPSIDPALEGVRRASGVEIGPDGMTWNHESIPAQTAFDMMKNVIAHCTPEWAEKICDVPAATIRRVANEMLAAATIGATIEIEGKTLPLRPVAIVLGKTVNNGWGGYQCVWARTMLACVFGALEVPGGTLGTAARMNRPNHTRSAAVKKGPDGFMSQVLNVTEPDLYAMNPKSRNGFNVLVPLSLDMSWSPALGPSHLSWLFQDTPPEGLPKATPPDVWFVYRTNPAISSWDASFVTERIAEFPFTVAFAYTRDESNHMADILLPDAMDLESTQLIRIGATKFIDQYWRHDGVALRQNVTELPGEVKDMSDIGTELAKRVGILKEYNRAINGGVLSIKLRGPNYDFSLDEAEPHSTETIWDAVCKAASAELTDGKETEGLDWYRQHGMRMKPYPKLEWYLYPKIVAEGLRFELPYQERLLRVGKQLGSRLHEHGIHWWDNQLADYEAIPEWSDFPRLWERMVSEAGGNPDNYPFWLLASNSMQFAFGAQASLQFMHEMAGNITGHGGLVINADRAAELGIEEGDQIEVATPKASTRGKAVLRQGIRPDTILAVGKFGNWATPYAKDFDTPSMNNLTPISLDLTDGTGSCASLARVSLKKIR